MMMMMMKSTRWLKKWSGARTAKIQTILLLLLLMMMLLSLSAGSGYCWAKPQTRSDHGHRCSRRLRHSLCRGNFLTWSFSSPIGHKTITIHAHISVLCSMFCSKWVLALCGQLWRLAPGLLWLISLLFPGSVHRKAIVWLRAWSIRNTWLRHQIRNNNSFLPYWCTLSQTTQSNYHK